MVDNNIIPLPPPPELNIYLNVVFFSEIPSIRASPILRRLGDSHKNKVKAPPNYDGTLLTHPFLTKNRYLKSLFNNLHIYPLLGIVSIITVPV